MITTMVVEANTEARIRISASTTGTSILLILVENADSEVIRIGIAPTKMVKTKTIKIINPFGT